MIDSYTFEQFNIKLVDFNYIFQSIEINLINDLSQYDLLRGGKIKRDTKKLLYHHLFYGICEYLIQNQSIEKIIILKKSCGTLSDNCQIFSYFSRSDIQKHIQSVVNMIMNFLPIIIYEYEEIDFSDIRKEYDSRQGNVVELLQKIQTFRWKRDSLRNKLTFAKVRNFVKRNNLTFLSEKYFNQLKTKQLYLS